MLSNRFVFKLVEQPPADMAALLHAFPSTPPVVRRRAKEVLAVIRSAVRKGLSGAAAPSEPTPVVPSEVTLEPTKDVDVSSEHPTPAPTPSSLWSHSKPPQTSTTSSLFGTVAVLPRLPSLFGVPPTSAAPKTKIIGRFQDVVNRIHSTLIIVPTVHRGPHEVTAATTTETVTTSAPDIPIDGETAEIPFVPAALRQTAKPEVIDDAIVVVGQRHNKCKRAKKAGITDDDGDRERSTSVSAAKTKAKTEEVVPFDFASVPNILDDGERSEQEDGRAVKTKRQKKALLERGDFPAAPKDRREVKSGNVSHTFRP
ncbi:hypothetical protein H4582DRAFT_1961793 [Lactarius indigo]|nr:hypothetical protein H4582DRAFT_1961793 [Lactarius indigo]